MYYSLDQDQLKKKQLGIDIPTACVNCDRCNFNKTTNVLQFRPRTTKKKDNLGINIPTACVNCDRWDSTNTANSLDRDQQKIYISDSTNTANVVQFRPRPNKINIYIIQALIYLWPVLIVIYGIPLTLLMQYSLGRDNKKKKQFRH